MSEVRIGKNRKRNMVPGKLIRIEVGVANWEEGKVDFLENAPLHEPAEIGNDIGILVLP